MSNEREENLYELFLFSDSQPPTHRLTPTQQHQKKKRKSKNDS